METLSKNISKDFLLTEKSNFNGLLLQKDVVTVSLICKFCSGETKAKPLRFNRILFYLKYSFFNLIVSSHTSITVSFDNDHFYDTITKPAYLHQPFRRILYPSVTVLK